MKAYLQLVAISILAASLCGCAGLSRLVLPPLEPELCKPSSDLPVKKSVPLLPERLTANDEFYILFLQGRKAHAKDAQDYNSLYGQCVLAE